MREYTQVLRDKKWKDVTGAFSFPSSATNASFILRKYYYSLLVHYEQIYFFRAAAWNHETISTSQLQFKLLLSFVTHFFFYLCCRNIYMCLFVSDALQSSSHRSREMPSSTNTQAAESREFGVRTTKSLPEGHISFLSFPFFFNKT